MVVTQAPGDSPDPTGWRKGTFYRQADSTEYRREADNGNIFETLRLSMYAAHISSAGLRFVAIFFAIH